MVSTWSPVPLPSPKVVPPVTHADVPLAVLVRVDFEDGRTEQWAGLAKAWTSTAVFVAVNGYLGWWAAEDVKRRED